MPAKYVSGQIRHINVPGRTGAALIELLFAGLASLLIGTALLTLLSTTYKAQQNVTGENTAYVSTRKALDTLADHLRNAQQYNNSGTYQVISAASASSVTCYTNSTGDTENYFIDTSSTPYALKRTQTISGSSSTKTVLTGIQTLTFTYYVANGGTYTSGNSWLPTANPSVPQASELPNIAAIGIQVTVSINGYSRTLSSLVRARNSPHIN